MQAFFTKDADDKTVVERVVLTAAPKPFVFDDAILLTRSISWEPVEIDSRCIGCRTLFEYDLALKTPCGHYVCEKCFSSNRDRFCHKRYPLIRCFCDQFNQHAFLAEIVMAYTDEDRSIQETVDALLSLGNSWCPLCRQNHSQEPSDGRIVCRNPNHSLCLECWNKLFRIHALPPKDVCVVCSSEEQIQCARQAFKETMTGWMKGRISHTCFECRKPCTEPSCCAHHSVHALCAKALIVTFFPQNMELKKIFVSLIIQTTPDNVCYLCVFDNACDELQRKNCFK